MGANQTNMAEAEGDLAAAILKQVDYYFSDVNLKRDRFFQKEIAKDPEGFISMDLLMRCNKLKQLTQDAAAVADAVGGSAVVALSEDRTKIRKVAAVPPLDPDVAEQQKNRASSKGGTSAEELAALISEKAAAACKERLVYKLTGLPPGCAWTDIKDSLKEVIQTQGRMHVSHQDGSAEAHITAFAEGNLEAWTAAAAMGDKLKVHDTVIQMQPLETDDAKLAFWTTEFTNHPPVMDRKVSKKETKQSPKKRKAATTVTVCDVEYDYNALKTRVLEISKAHTEEYEELQGDEKAFMSAVFEFHPRAAEKRGEMSGVGVGVNPEFPDTRCFFLVQADKKEDFSYKKCIDTAFGVEDKRAKAE